jgi:hypothetical protein
MRFTITDTDLLMVEGLTPDQLRLTCGKDKTPMPRGLKAGSYLVIELESLVGPK